MKGTRIVFMGTPDFAIPSLNALIQAQYEVLVVTQPDRPVGRKQIVTPPPVKTAAKTAGLQVLQPDKVRDEQVIRELSDFGPDLIVTAAFGQLLPKKLLEVPRVGALNVHASLLPKWRGAAPIHRALLAGDAQTGVTIMEMVRALDAGPIVGMEKTAILDSDDVGTMHSRLAAIGATLLLRLLPDYLNGNLPAIRQEEACATYAERIVRTDEFIDLSQPVRLVFNHIRGLSPWPGVTMMVGTNRLKIWTSALFDDVVTGPVGLVTHHMNGAVLVQCGTGHLELQIVQPAGKRKMTAVEWLRGLGNAPIRLERVYEA